MFGNAITHRQCHKTKYHDLHLNKQMLCDTVAGLWHGFHSLAIGWYLHSLRQL